MVNSQIFDMFYLIFWIPLLDSDWWNPNVAEKSRHLSVEQNSCFTRWNPHWCCQWNIPWKNTRIPGFPTLTNPGRRGWDARRDNLRQKLADFPQTDIVKEMDVLGDHGDHDIMGGPWHRLLATNCCFHFTTKNWDRDWQLDCLKWRLWFSGVHRPSGLSWQKRTDVNDKKHGAESTIRSNKMEGWNQECLMFNQQKRAVVTHLVPWCSTHTIIHGDSWGHHLQIRLSHQYVFRASKCKWLKNNARHSKDVASTATGCDYDTRIFNGTDFSRGVCTPRSISLVNSDEMSLSWTKYQME